MDINTIIEIIGRLLAALVVALLAYLAPKAKQWFDTAIDKESQDAILTLIRSFARAAEQLLKDEDPTGEKRKAFVIEQLQALGIEITNAVLSMIEGEVWKINVATKAAEGVELLPGELLQELQEDGETHA